MKENTEKRLTVLETNQQELIRKLDKIMDNHLPHIQKELECLNDEIKKIELTMARWVGGLGVLLFVLNLALKFIN